MTQKHTPEFAQSMSELRHATSQRPDLVIEEIVRIKAERDRLKIVNTELLAVCEREAAMPCRCAAPHSQCISCAARAAIAKAREVK